MSLFIIVSELHLKLYHFITKKCRYLEKLYGHTDKEIDDIINNKELFDGYYPELEERKTNGKNCKMRFNIST